MADSAHTLETSLDLLLNNDTIRQHLESNLDLGIPDGDVKNDLSVLAQVFTPVLNFLQSPPIRAIIIFVVVCVCEILLHEYEF